MSGQHNEGEACSAPSFDFDMPNIDYSDESSYDIVLTDTDQLRAYFEIPPEQRRAMGKRVLVSLTDDARNTLKTLTNERLIKEVGRNGLPPNTTAAELKVYLDDLWAKQGARQNSFRLREDLNVLPPDADANFQNPQHQ